MDDLSKGIQSILEAQSIVKPNERVLIIADNEGESTWLGQHFMNVAASMGAEAVLIIVNPPKISAAEPPASVAAAMKNTDVVIRVSEKAPFAHTNARKEANMLGVRVKLLGDMTADDLRIGADPSLASNLRLIAQRTQTITELLTKAKEARITSKKGTNITLSLSGRESIAIHGLDPMKSSIGWYAESAISPVEGTAEGTIIVDIAFIDWHYLLREPLHLSVKKGRVVDIQGDGQDVERLSNALAKYENASNIAELGIGTSHMVPLPMHGSRRDAARLGTAHFALGRNSDIGGGTVSEVHWDLLIDKPTIELDGRIILNQGELAL